MAWAVNGWGFSSAFECVQLTLEAEFFEDQVFSLGEEAIRCGSACGRRRHADRRRDLLHEAAGTDGRLAAALGQRIAQRLTEKAES